MSVIRLGNPAPVDNLTGRRIPGPRVTTVHLPDGIDTGEALATINGLWPRHSAHPHPAWVDGDPALTDVLAAAWGCPSQEDPC